jgi:probable rRNA maturation factor
VPPAPTAADLSVELEIHGGDSPELRRAAEAALGAVGVRDGHIAISFVGEGEIRKLNLEHRGRDAATDVLSFPIDGTGPVHGPRELGDIVICREHTDDVVEAVVHGVLHLCGYDHDADGGEMLALQDRILATL